MGLGLLPPWNAQRHLRWRFRLLGRLRPRERGVCSFAISPSRLFTGQRLMALLYLPSRIARSGRAIGSRVSAKAVAADRDTA